MFGQEEDPTVADLSYWDTRFMHHLSKPGHPLSADNLNACFVFPSMGGEVAHISGIKGEWKNASWWDETCVPGNHVCHYEELARWGRTLHGFSRWDEPPDESGIWFEDPSDYDKYRWRSEPVAAVDIWEKRQIQSGVSHAYLEKERLGLNSNAPQRQ